MAKEMKVVYEEINSFKSFLDFCCDRYGENNFFVRKTADGVEHITYNKYRLDCLKFAAGLLKAGIENEHIAILSENAYEYLVMYYGTVISGNVFLPINYMVEPEKIFGMIDFADVTRVYISDKFSSFKEGIKANCPKVKDFIEVNGDNGRLTYNGIINSVSDEEALRIESKDSVYNDKTSLLCFTSGTSGGVPKAVMLSVKNILACVRYGNGDEINECGNIHALRCLPLPLYHLAALNFPIYVFMYQGTEMCLCKEVRDVFADMVYYKPGYVIVVPAISEFILKMLQGEVLKSGKMEEFKEINRKFKEGLISREERDEYVKQFRSVVGGNLISITLCGAKSSAAVKNGLRQFGIGVHDGYGMTECSPMVSFEFYEEHDGSAGKVCAFNEVKVVDGVGYVKGDNVMSGYYKNEEATREVLSEDGWFCTGDLTRVDEDEYVYILGRAKDIIVLSDGENIDPQEIEAVILESPFVAEAVVVPDEKSNNTRVGVLVFPNAEAIAKVGKDAETVIAEAVSEANKKLPLAKRMSRFKIMNKPFDKNFMMKLLRRNYPDMSV